MTPGQETEGAEKIISTLSKAYTEQHPNVTLKYEAIPQTDLIQRIQLLAGSNSLPTMFAYESGAPLITLIEGNKVLDVEKTFTDLGIYDQLNPATVSLLKSLTAGKGLYAIPVELNIEGFWYNKKIFADNGLQEPKTWDELLQVAETLNGKGIQPFSASGQQGWPLTRLINGYVIRKYGPDVVDGANIYQAFFRIVLPMAKNAIVTVALTQFFFIWNDLILSLTFISETELRTLQTGLLSFVGQYGQRQWGPTFAAIAMSVVPLLVLYMALNNLVIKGLTSGAVKG